MSTATGDKGICMACKAEIIFTGHYWDHVGDRKPRHPALPRLEVTVTPLTQHTPETFQANLAAAYANGVRAGEQAQLQRDAEAICYYCSAHDEFEPALWMDEDLEPGDYRHKNKTGRGSAWCQASLIWADWAGRQVATAPAKTD